MTEVLEYKPVGVRAKTRRSREALKARIREKSPLRYALVQSGIKPFTEASVEAYKEKMQRARGPHPAHLFIARILNEGGAITAWAALLSLFGACALLLASCVSAAIGLYAGWSAVAVDAPYYSAVFIGTGVVMLWAMYLFFYLNELRVPKWRLRPVYRLAELPGPIRLTAQEVLHFCPGAEFWVDELTEGDKVLDPFLVVRCCKEPESQFEEFYIAVWDEEYP